MATLKTGVIIKTRGSVGGVNFYNRLGVQCLRNKPVRSESYVSSPAQMYQQSVFKIAADYSKSSQSVTDLIRGGWGMKKAGKGRTGFNNFSSEVLRKLSRDEAGVKVDQATYEANVTAFKSNPGGWCHENLPLTMSKYATLGAAGVLAKTGDVGAEKLTITVAVSVLNDWLRVNARQYGVVGDPEDVKLLLGGAILGSTSKDWYLELSGSVSGDNYVFELPSTVDTDAETYDVAFAFYPASSGIYGAPSEPAISQYARLAMPNLA